LTESSGFN